MTKHEQLQRQVDAQERQILSLRAKLAEERARVANLQRMHDHDQRHIQRLQQIIDKHPQDLAAKVFGGQDDGD